MRIGIALAAGFTLLVIALGVTLSRSPVVVAHANSTAAGGTVAETQTAAKACQAGELLPGGTSAIRLTLKSVTGPTVSVSALSGTHVLTSGSVGSGWTGGSVTVPVKAVAHTTHNTKICFKLGPTRETVVIIGEQTSRSVAAKGEGRALPGRLKIEYLRVNNGSWWSVAPEVARRLGFGRALNGAWIVFPLLALMIAAVACASWLTVRELR